MRRATLKVVAGRGAMPAGQAVPCQLPPGGGGRSFTTAAASSTEATHKYDFINVRCGSLILTSSSSKICAEEGLTEGDLGQTICTSGGGQGRSAMGVA
jgi:hypothetical protein